MSQRLTAAQRAVLELVGCGLTTKQIAARLAIRPATVESHIRAAMDRLDARTRLHARVGVSVEHRGLHTRAEDAQVLSTRRGRAAALAQHQVEARDVLGANSPDSLPTEHPLRVDGR
jgi:DNA-binding CsgD family transcriptional regulator